MKFVSGYFSFSRNRPPDPSQNIGKPIEELGYRFAELSCLRAFELQTRAEQEFFMDVASRTVLQTIMAYVVGYVGANIISQEIERATGN